MGLKKLIEKLFPQCGNTREYQEQTTNKHLQSVKARKEKEEKLLQAPPDNKEAEETLQQGPNEKNRGEMMLTHIDEMKRILERCSAQLFIFVEAEEQKELKNAYTYTYVTLSNWPFTINSNPNANHGQGNLKNIKDTWKKNSSHKQIHQSSDYFKNVKKDLQKQIQDNNNENKIIESGKDLHNELIPEKAREELKIANDKINTIFVFYKGKDIDYIWEWLYEEGKNKKDNFFWGDKFNIIRIPEEPLFSTDSTFKIEKVAILCDTKCSVAENTVEVLKNILSDKINTPEKIALTNSSADISTFDCVHVMAIGETFEKDDTYLNCGEMFNKLKASKGANKLNFLFLNIYSPKPTDPTLVKNIFDDSAKMRIDIVDPSFNVSSVFARIFTRYFYECLIEEGNVAKALRKARERIDNDKKKLNLGCERFWRFLYVVNGNPSTRVTWGKS